MPWFTAHHCAASASLPIRLLIAALLLTACAAAAAQSRGERHLDQATEVLAGFLDGGPESIPPELMERALGIAVIPNTIRAGFILGARRGRGVLSIRTADGGWSNPAFVTLTGGSVGWQIGAESTDVVIVFANENAVRNIARGKFTLGGEASAVAGPLRKQAASTMTFRAEVYGYLRSRGLYAGAALQGARLRVDDDLATDYYGNAFSALAAPGAGAADSVRRFLSRLDAAASGIESVPESAFGESGLRTFPLPD